MEFRGLEIDLGWQYDSVDLATYFLIAICVYFVLAAAVITGPRSWEFTLPLGALVIASMQLHFQILHFRRSSPIQVNGSTQMGSTN